MRIISGKFRGLQFKIPGGLPVRPTTDFAKTGLFNILTNRYNLDECKVLDLYSGTGNLSFEFVSRGAENVTAVDINRKCTSFIRDSIERLGIHSSMEVILADAEKFLKQNKHSYDIIVADPPYAITPAAKLTELIFNNQFLKPGGVFILEHSSDVHFKELEKFTEERRYGQVAFSFFSEESKD